ncbi:MAG: hypothetical protein AB9907_01190 [Flexilinea sp.]
MVFKIQQMAWRSGGESGSLDYRYWEQQGWFDPGKTYFIPHQAGWLKVALAQLCGFIIGKLMV